MKTLVVLSALVAVALAAPTLLEQGSKDFKKFTNVPVTFKRETKSLQESTQSDPAPGVPANQPSTSHISEFGVSGRSFGPKKPLIIKKKPVGYQVYRDSDEVPVESGETCGSQVKVKFCDGKAQLKSSTIEDADTQMTEEEMKHSISMAKEAIETLQRDLSTVEKKPGTQLSSWNHGNSESDAELHQDIEVAREALEHIHKNFGNFESMSLHATTLKEVDMVPEASFTIAKTEEQRLAQWKEAMNTIQKNVEIAKNIEDSFKMAPDSEPGLLISNDMIENNKHELNKKIDHNLRTSQDVIAKQENKVESDCETEHAHEKSSEEEKPKVGLLENDMTLSASTISEEKVNEGQIKQTPQLSTETKTDQLLKSEKSFEGTTKENNDEVNMMTLNDLSHKSLVSDSMKSVEDNKEEKNKNDVLTESAESLHALTKGIKSVETEDMLLENQKKAAVSTESLEKLETDTHPEMKSAEHFDDQSNIKNKKEDKIQEDLHTEQSRQIETTLFSKSAEEVPNMQQELMFEPKIQSEIVANEPEKHLAEEKIASNVDLKSQKEILASVNDAEQMEMQQHQSLFHPEMRTTEDVTNMNQQLMLNPQSRWSEDKDMQMQRESMTSAHGIHSHTVQHPGHQHHVAHGMNNHHFENPSGRVLQSRFPEHFNTQEKSADSDMQAYYMGMRDGSGLTPENHRFRWKPTHEGLRTAYGAPAAPAASSQSSGAVGVFPNANLGGCGIPLLLSCNPTVMSGSLAKPTPVPYSAPAYRTEGDFTFHTKRDVKKTHENLPSPLHRTPKGHMKTSTVLVAKQ